MTNEDLTIEDFIAVLLKEYDRAKKNKQVKKPIAYSAYKAWRYADTHDSERSVHIDEAESI